MRDVPLREQLETEFRLDAPSGSAGSDSEKTVVERETFAINSEDENEESRRYTDVVV